MLDAQNIKDLAERELTGSDLYVVQVRISPSNEVEVTVDSDSSVSIDACARLSRALEEELEKITDDFALTVASSGIGQPLRVLRQYVKLTGRPVETILKNGTKITAILKRADENGITLCYEEKVAVEGKKRKETVERLYTYAFDEIKSTVEHLDFK